MSAANSYPTAPKGSAIHDFFGRLEAHGLAYGGRDGNGGNFQCPAHDDHMPSLHVEVGETAAVVCVCRSCGASLPTVLDALAARNAPTVHGKKIVSVRSPLEGSRVEADAVEWGIVRAQGTARSSAGQDELGKYLHTVVHDYLGPSGEPIRRVSRAQYARGKVIAQLRPYVASTGFRSWIAGVQGVPVTPYYWQDFAKWRASGKRGLYLVEGEKAADALVDAGHCATTYPGGANGTLPSVDEIRQHLSGFRYFKVWADADEPGLLRAFKVRDLLNEAFPEAKASVVTNSGSPRKGDDAADIDLRDIASARVTIPTIEEGRALLSISARAAEVVGSDTEMSQRPHARWKVLGPEELSSMPKPVDWLVQGVAEIGSYGPHGAEKKTLKSYNEIALALAVASGKQFLGRFKVHRSGPVVYFAGEGSVEGFKRRRRRVAQMMGISEEQLRQVPLYMAPGGGNFDDPAFMGFIREVLDDWQPVLVIFDSFYNFHPAGPQTGNLYDRGELLARVQHEVCGHGDCTLRIPDHFRKANGKKPALDLDSIGMTGMSQWADHWQLSRHLHAPTPEDVARGSFRIETEFGNRDGGAGGRYLVEWELGAVDTATGLWLPDSTPTVTCHDASGVREVAMYSDADVKVVKFVHNHPGTSRNGIREGTGLGNSAVDGALRRLEADGLLRREDGPVKSNGSPTRTNWFATEESEKVAGDAC